MTGKSNSQDTFLDEMQIKPWPLLSNFFILCSFCRCKLLQSESYVYSRCSSEKFPSESPYQTSLIQFLQSAVTSASQISYASFENGNESTTEESYTTLFGLYQCRGDLKSAECSRCVRSASNQIYVVCSSSLGASMQLQGCSIRYENINFLGVLDTSIMFKLCSRSSATDDIEFIRQREEVLVELQTTSSFKVSSSGLVEGFAQCLGDIGSDYCSACLAEALTFLKALCGPSASGSVFLRQCYAKYWASGYYDASSDKAGKADGVGKSIAVVIGGVGGVALVVVILSICHRRFG